MLSGHFPAARLPDLLNSTNTLFLLKVPEFAVCCVYTSWMDECIKDASLVPAGAMSWETHKYLASSSYPPILFTTLAKEALAMQVVLHSQLDLVKPHVHIHIHSYAILLVEVKFYLSLGITLACIW